MKILISACLMGQKVRYDGQAKPLAHPLIDRWWSEGRLVVICPELAGGFQVPRLPAEIADGASGQSVLAGSARVVETSGRDVTAAFVAGAQKALELACGQACRVAMLIDGSPSCGSGFVYDGNFNGVRHSGQGVTSALLRDNGIEVFAPGDIVALAARIEELDAASIEP